MSKPRLKKKKKAAARSSQPRIRLLWQLLVSFLFITFISLFAVSWYTYQHLLEFYDNEKADNLTARARMVHYLIQELDPVNDQPAINRICQELGNRTNTRITVILRNGTVIGESDRNPQEMDDHSDREEVIQALSSGVGMQRRFSNTMGKSMFYVAIPWEQNGELIGVVRTSFDVSAIDNTRSTIYGQIALGGIVIALMAAAMSLWISRHISSPLEMMKRMADRFARGELSGALPTSQIDEVNGLALAMNAMARQLDERINTITRQSHELETILTSMREGVVAVDSDERIITINQAAIKLFSIESMPNPGKPLNEIVNNEDVLRVVYRAGRDAEPFEDEIIAGKETNLRFLRVNGTSLRDENNERIGAVVVFNDMTHLRKLENLRSEFVANVSHELKTPITSIKGFVETLLDGAMHDAEDAVRFLGIIAKQSDRLHAIIEDLLSLSRIEQGVENTDIPLEEGRLFDVLHAAIESCEAKASDKRMQIDLECERDLMANINPPLLEQALVNLIDNAIKYSDPENRVLVRTRTENRHIEIQVQDWGQGIEPDHLPRLFERFYRVDKARSRKMGGTGLGLAIVKHIAQAHNGTIEVESEVGKGSLFSINIPNPM